MLLLPLLLKFFEPDNFGIEVSHLLAFGLNCLLDLRTLEHEKTEHRRLIINAVFKELLFLSRRAFMTTIVYL